jgi:regulator of extracellular matrix RemA (YlzA/DUF370 family)
MLVCSGSPFNSPFEIKFLVQVLKKHLFEDETLGNVGFGGNRVTMIVSPNSAPVNDAANIGKAPNNEAAASNAVVSDVTKNAKHNVSAERVAARAFGVS